MKPGMTIVPAQSMTSALAATLAGVLGPTAALFLPSIRTSALSESPTLAARRTPAPPRSGLGRLRPSPPRPCVSADVAERKPASWPGTAAAVNPAAAALKKSRRWSRVEEECLDIVGLALRVTVVTLLQRRVLGGRS